MMLERQKKKIKDLQKENKFEEFIVRFIYIVLFIAYNLFELYLAYLIGKYSNKVIELAIILGAFFLNKAIFGKPLHFRNNFICLGVSLLMFYVDIQCAFTLNLSILTNVIIGVLSGAITSYIASYLYDENKKMTNREKIIAKLNGNTSQEYIFEYCRNNGFKEDMANTIDLFLNNTYQETSEILDVDDRTIRRKVKQFIES